MFAPRIRGALSLCIMAIAAACGGGTTENGGNGGDNSPAALAKVSGDGQTGLVGQALATPLSVKVSTSTGTVLSGVTVNFAVISGAASVNPSSATTDATGVAKTVVTLGSSAGTVQITATVSGTALTAQFTVTAGSGTITSACTGATPITPAVGAPQTVSGSGTCLGGVSGGADYAVIAFNSDPDSTLTPALFTVKSSGATALPTANVAPSANVAPLGSTLSALRIQTPNVRERFDAKLRRTAQRELAPRMAMARSTMRRRGSFNAIPGSPSFQTIPSAPSVGQMITLNAQGQSACEQIINVRARIAAISNNAIIAADSLNPAGGFTDAEYQSFATTFDTLINPLDVGAFGQPTDIDKNGKILILFTKEVNKLTPRGSSGFIGGFFFERDLFPLQDDQTTGLPGCAGSNVGEMFYVLVPDSAGTFADKRTKADVLDNTPSTLAHEYQHLINAGRRMYVNNANDFESVWLNEGLSHVAEELLYYHVSGFTPRSNIAFSNITGNSKQVAAFNSYAGDNFGRYEIFLSKPAKTAVYGDNDSLETRGATWSLLRYLADHRAVAGDGDTWQQLVNTTLAGQANLKHVFGADLATMIQNWATSVFTDDITGNTNTVFLMPSYNMRDLFFNFCTDNRSPCTRLQKYPLSVVPLSDASPASLSVVAGGEAYLRFTVPSGSQASIDWANGGLPVSPLVRFTVVRTR